MSALLQAAQTPEQFRELIEVEVLKVMGELAQSEEFSQGRLSEISELALSLLKPGMSVDEIYQNAVKLDDTYSELAPVVHLIMKEYEKVHEKKALSAVSELIKSGNYEDAQNVVKKVLAFKANI